MMRGLGIKPLVLTQNLGSEIFILFVRVSSLDWSTNTDNYRLILNRKICGLRVCKIIQRENKTIL